MKTKRRTERRIPGDISVSFEIAHALARRVARVRVRLAVKRGVIQPADVEDAMQDAVIACWLALANFDPGRASLRTYFEWVVATRIASFIRAGHRLGALCPLDVAGDHHAAPAFPHHELRIDVERLLRVCRNP